MKKKVVALFLSALLACSVLAGCGDTEEIDSTLVTEESVEASATQEESSVSESRESSSEEPSGDQSPSAEATASSEAAPSTGTSTTISTETTISSQPVVVDPSQMYRSELTNQWISQSIQNQRPVAIMVDNEKTALDHYGVTQADIVYEMMNSTANDEVTRLMCIVKDWGSITRFGSIRSVRPTNFMIAPEYNAVLIHDGGPFYINDYLSNPWVNNLSGGFARIDNGKAREFTEYVTTGEIASRMKGRGYSTEYNSYYQGQQWQFADETSPVNLGSASDSFDCTLVDLPFPHNASQLDYDAASNTYLYSEYGRAHVDPQNGNKQLAFTNVIVQCADLTQLDANGYMQFNVLNSSGSGYYITGGKAIPVTWSKGNAVDATTFYDASGNEITLNTGKTYIALVASYRWGELVLR